MTLRKVGVAVVAVVVMVVIGPLTLGGSAGATTSSETTTVSTSGCAPGWSLPPSGVVSLAVNNEAHVTVDTELVDRANGAIVAALKELGPGTTRSLDASLQRGIYELVCIFDNPTGTSISTPYHYRHSSPQSVTTGVTASSATPAVQPITAAELAGPVAKYEKYVAGQIGVLESQVVNLQSDISQNNEAQAKIDWLAAELTFSGIGGTYGALGPLQDEINGLPFGLEGGVNNPGFVGLHKIEDMLWSGQPTTAIEPFTNDLVQAVNQLHVLWATGPMTPNLLSTRAHEILEDAQRDTLSGNDDFGSESSLARAWAEMQGEQVILNDLHIVIDERSPKLFSTAEADLNSVDRTIQSAKVSGEWVPLSSITVEQREQIDAAIDQALETLSQIPDLLEVQQFTDGQGT